ncbi:MAG: dihydrolipoamide acetyltransferase [Pseudomonadales bacterium]|nr:dihydrolipoamide acetyltransferase [Pseudomonadales bacterium]
MAIENITVPDLGDATEVEVIELLVSVGQEVAENDSLLVLESDKAAMEIPAPMAGVVKSIAVNLGDQVTTGSEMLSLEVEEAAGSLSEETAKVAKPEEAASAEEVKEDIADEVPVSTEVAAITIEVPDLGTDDEVDVIEMHVNVGDSVAVDESLITLESDKAAMEVPSPQAGEVTEWLIAVGDKVKTGSAIAVIKGTAATVAAEKPAAKSPAPEQAESPKPAPTPAPIPTPAPAPAAASDKVYAGPAVRKLARELGVELTLVPGTGAKNRIIKEDIHAFVKNRINAPVGSGTLSSAVPDIDFSRFGEIEQIPRTKLDKLTATNMHRNWTAVPHVAQFNEADVSDLEDFRAELKSEGERRGVKLTFLPFLLKACAKALREYPQFNVSLHSSGEYLIQKKYFHIGVAVATEAGLVVPVIRNVDQKSIWQLAEEVITSTDKAKQRKLTMEDMQGACFTISSLGAIGGTGFIPIVNAPEVAILGVGKTDIKPVFIDGEFKPRKMLPITLAYDHKVVNGVDGGLFATYLATLLADIRHLVL